MTYSTPFHITNFVLMHDLELTGACSRIVEEINGDSDDILTYSPTNNFTHYKILILLIEFLFYSIKKKLDTNQEIDMELEMVGDLSPINMFQSRLLLTFL